MKEYRKCKFIKDVMFEDLQRLIYALKQKKEQHVANQTYSQVEITIWVDLSKYLKAKHRSPVSEHKTRYTLKTIVHSWTSFLKQMYMSIYPYLTTQKMPVAEFRHDKALSATALAAIVDYIGEKVVEFLFDGKMFFKPVRIVSTVQSVVEDSDSENDEFNFNPLDDDEVFQLNPDTVHFLSATGKCYFVLYYTTIFLLFYFIRHFKEIAEIAS